MRFPDQKAYPKFILFGVETYKLKFIKGLEHYGETDPVDKEIRIKAGMSPRNTFMTFIHEALHLIEFEAPVKLKHKTIYKLEAAIFQLLADNF